MGRIKGFLEYKRDTALKRPINERLNDFCEVTERLSDEQVCRQAARCMDCGIAFCHEIGCPLCNLIPEWNEYLYRNRWEDAHRRLELTNNFPEITGRICPAPCEAACTLSINDSPVSIRENELGIIENAFSRGWVKPLPALEKTGLRVAVIGSGPAGLAAAQQLVRLGHEVMVLEKDEKPGGILRYGIPGFKLEKWVIDRRLEQLHREGVEFETEVNAGVDISAHYLKKSFDAILLACGSETPRDLDVPGRSLEGVYFAMDYLSNSNRYVAADTPVNRIISARGKNVLVIGGGDTGADCVGTANRQGAKKVFQFEILPQPPDWKKPWNPDWPRWPNILRTSTSHEEGCERRWCVMTKSFHGREGRITQARAVKVDWKTSGEKQFPVELEGTEFTLSADLVILCMGFTGTQRSRLLTDLGLDISEKGALAIDPNYMTAEPGVFAAGDTVTGPSLVVQAIHQGREAAGSIHEFITARAGLAAHRRAAGS